MTCIAAIKSKEGIYMAGDAAGVGGLSLSKRIDPKVFVKEQKLERVIKNNEIVARRQRFIMGYTSSFRMGQLLQYKFSPPECTTNDLMKYMVVDFVDALRECLKDSGYSHISNNVESGGIFLVGFKGELFKIGSDFQVARNLENYNSVGCGSDIALGSLHSTETLVDQSDIRLEMALEAASAFSAGVSGPYTIEFLERE